MRIRTELRPQRQHHRDQGDNTVRLVPLADYGVYISTPSLKAITSKDATDTETLLLINLLTA